MPNSCLKYYGGKFWSRERIATLLMRIPAINYVEPFFGAGHVFFTLPTNTFHRRFINDLSGDLVNFWEVIADPDLYKQFMRRVKYLPYSRQLYHNYCAALKAAPDSRPSEEGDGVKRAAMWFMVNRMNF